MLLLSTYGACRPRVPVRRDQLAHEWQNLKRKRARDSRSQAAFGPVQCIPQEQCIADLPEVDLMRSIRLFGEKVMPALRDHEPF